ncbi:hypothetical protein [Gemmobacter sp. 24YEA27]|uniref:hypothetical protein n=1 Tax=Gemmobacter sp. 24YEA27 TaxID=3040672 RepID=UPI0024B34A72|nr:hypothetical protein [Gemmobacter sp. 24YEA27]
MLTPDPVSGELQIEVRGDLAGILTIALERRKPAFWAGGVQVDLVAGTCGHWRHKSCSPLFRLGGSDAQDTHQFAA